MGRAPDERPNRPLEAFYGELLAALVDPTFRSGVWQLCELDGWADNPSYRNLAAWCWSGERRWVIVVNLGNDTATGMLRTPWPDLQGQMVRLTDPTQHSVYVRSGDELTHGLFVELCGGAYHLFLVEPTL